MWCLVPVERDGRRRLDFATSSTAVLGRTHGISDDGRHGRVHRKHAEVVVSAEGALLVRQLGKTALTRVRRGAFGDETVVTVGIHGTLTMAHLDRLELLPSEALPKCCSYTAVFSSAAAPAPAPRAALVQELDSPASLVSSPAPSAAAPRGPPTPTTVVGLRVLIGGQFGIVTECQGEECVVRFAAGDDDYVALPRVMRSLVKTAAAPRAAAPAAAATAAATLPAVKPKAAAPPSKRPASKLAAKPVAKPAPATAAKPEAAVSAQPVTPSAGTKRATQKRPPISEQENGGEQAGARATKKAFKAPRATRAPSLSAGAAPPPPEPSADADVEMAEAEAVEAAAIRADLQELAALGPAAAAPAPAPVDAPAAAPVAAPVPAPVVTRIAPAPVPSPALAPVALAWATPVAPGAVPAPVALAAPAPVARAPVAAPPTALQRAAVAACAAARHASHLLEGVRIRIAAAEDAADAAGLLALQGELFGAVEAQRATAGAKHAADAARGAEVAQERRADAAAEEEKAGEVELDEEQLEEDVFHAYAPAKLRQGKSHPTTMVETVSLSWVEPPDLSGRELHCSLLEGDVLSSLQARPPSPSPAPSPSHSPPTLALALTLTLTRTCSPRCSSSRSPTRGAGTRSRSHRRARGRASSSATAPASARGGK